ncbi:MAG TPA: hypothetical protein VLR89_00400 [Anaerolineaceae bacterium]|nr:hypothetical protein [Anaerolineaceae bacterium]
MKQSYLFLIIISLVLSGCALSPTIKQPSTYTPDPARQLEPGAPTSNPFFTKTATLSASTPISIIPDITKTIGAEAFTSTPVRTSTPVPHTPRPTPNDGSLLHEDFSYELSGWDRNTSSSSTADYADGQYRIFVATPNQEIWANPGKWFPDGIKIDVDVKYGKGPTHSDYGVICGYVDANNYFALTIGPDGWVEIFKRLNGERSTLYSEARNLNIREKGNHLTAICGAQTLTLLVNKTQIAQVSDPYLSGGDIGLISGSFEDAKVEFYFDNLVVMPAGQ